MNPYKPKEKKCKACKEFFTPQRPLQSVCNINCSVKYSAILRQSKAEKEARKENKEAKVKMLTHKDYLKLLQVVFNTFVRCRDSKENCISCDCNMQGKKGDASHFYSVGSTPNLRFNEDNVHLSCVYCNQHLHGNLLEYSVRLPIRIGYKRFQELKELKNKPSLKLTIPEIQALIAEYKQKIKSLK